MSEEAVRVGRKQRSVWPGRRRVLGLSGVQMVIAGLAFAPDVSVGLWLLVLAYVVACVAVGVMFLPLDSDAKQPRGSAWLCTYMLSIPLWLVPWMFCVWFVMAVLSSAAGKWGVGPDFVLLAMSISSPLLLWCEAMARVSRVAVSRAVSFPMALVAPCPSLYLPNSDWHIILTGMLIHATLAVTTSICVVLGTMPGARNCAKCGYDLHGLTRGRCSECGEEFVLLGAETDAQAADRQKLS